MSFLDKVKNAAGVGAATIEVDLSQRPSKRGDELVALVRLIPGKTAQKVNFLGINVDVAFALRTNHHAPLPFRMLLAYFLATAQHESQKKSLPQKPAPRQVRPH